MAYDYEQRARELMLQPLERERYVALAKGEACPDCGFRLTERERFETAIVKHARSSHADLSDAFADAERNEVMRRARSESRNGYVQHVNILSDGSYRVSDWYDADSTIASFENGRRIS